MYRQAYTKQSFPLGRRITLDPESAFYNEHYTTLTAAISLFLNAASL